MTVKWIALGALASLAAAPVIGAQGNDDRCIAALAALASSWACTATGEGVVLAPDQSRADTLAAYAIAGETQFARHFANSAPTYAVLEIYTPESTAARRSALEAAGFPRVFAWLSAAAQTEAMESSMRRGVEAQMRAAGATGEKVEDAVQKALHKVRGDDPQARDAKREATVIPHELGHLWYIDAYWPQPSKAAPATPGDHVDDADAPSGYGGPGPDWMDETAAILMEPEDTAAGRRKSFKRIYDGVDTDMFADYPRDRLVDLAAFLDNRHPGAARIRATGVSAKAAGPVILTGEEARDIAKHGTLFYLQARMFADFLVERTGDPAIFGSIGVALGRDQGFAQWLAKHGPAHGLPGDIATLGRDWQAWLVEATARD